MASPHSTDGDHAGDGATGGAARYLTHALWLLLALELAVVFALSHQPDLRISQDRTLDLVLRKLAHVAAYAAISATAALALVRSGVSSGRGIVAGFAFAVLYATSDEWHQGFVRGRVASPVDVAIDTIGAALAAASLAWYHRRHDLGRIRR